MCCGWGVRCCGTGLIVVDRGERPGAVRPGACGLRVGLTFGIVPRARAVRCEPSRRGRGQLRSVIVGLLKEFRDFAVKGNALDLAVGVIIGAAFGKIVNSIVNDLLMPPIGVLLGGVDFSDIELVIKEGVRGVAEVKQGETVVTPAIAEVPEVAVRFGSFVNIIIEFTIVAFCVFMVVKAFNTLRQRMEAEKSAAVPAAPPPPTPEQALLGEIRDLLRSGR